MILASLRLRTAMSFVAAAMPGLLAFPVAVEATGRGAPLDALSAAPSRPPRPLTAEEERLRSAGREVRYDEVFGVPNFVWTAPSGGVSASARRARPRDPVAEARRHLEETASLYDLDADDVRALRVTQVHDTGQGPVIVKFREDIDGIEVFREEVTVLMDRGLERVAVSGHVGGAAARAARPAVRVFQLDAADAAAIAVIDRTEDADFSAVDLEVTGPARDGWTTLGQRTTRRRAGGALLAAPLRTKPVFFHDPAGHRAAYAMEVDAGVVGDETDGHLVSYVIAADDGDILFRHDMTASDAYSYRVQARTAGDHAPYGEPYGGAAVPHPTGAFGAGEPAYAAASLVALQNGPISTSDAWLPAGAAETTGNNVDAYADLASPDGFGAGDLRATTTSPGVFDRTYDFQMEPGAGAGQTAASVTQLFYTANWLHDFFYEAGFDEAAGNGQQDNYGRGGLEGDRIKVEAQDSSGTNNADMTTPSDGGRPRMQMYPWAGLSSAGVTVDSPPMADEGVAVASFGAQSFEVTAEVAMVDDGIGVASDGCEPVVNAAAVAGHIALVDRGECNFSTKVEHAFAAGAVGVLVANNVGTTAVTGMSGTCTGPCPIGVLMVSHDRGAELAAALGLGAVQATMHRDLGPSRDGSFDGDIVAHEWGHFLSGRLVGDGNGLNSQQSAGLGEGWSDFVALLMSVEEGDDPGAVYPVATYASAAFSDDPAYFGLRRFPYSTDRTKDPLTFRHIGDGVPVAGAPCSGDCTGSSNSEVHHTGEVWATMLWDCYAGLLADTTGPSPRLAFADAKERMTAYLVQHLKLMPSNPTFTEARDALLAVATAGDPSDAEVFCQAFAGRGIGQGAVPPARFSDTNAGVVESYVCVPPATCAAAPRGDCRAGGAGLVKFQGSATDPSRQALQWKWSAGTAGVADFGDPATGSTNYRLCIYDDGVLTAAAGLAAGDLCGGRACWKTASAGYSYRNSAGNAEGLASVRMKAGTGNASIQVKGRGAALGLPFPVTGTSAVTVQLAKDSASGGGCWSTTFAAPATKSDPVALRFADRLP